MIPVLTADDDESTRVVIRQILEDEGYPVIEAADGWAALDLLTASAAPLAVLLDDRMPGKSGMQVLEAVEADPLLRRHAYTLLTGQFGIELALPFEVGVLPKPFDLDDLIHAVREMECRLGGGC